MYSCENYLLDALIQCITVIPKHQGSNTVVLVVKLHTCHLPTCLQLQPFLLETNQEASQESLFSIQVPCAISPCLSTTRTPTAPTTSIKAPCRVQQVLVKDFSIATLYFQRPCRFCCREVFPQHDAVDIRHHGGEGIFLLMCGLGYL